MKMPTNVAPVAVLVLLAACGSPQPPAPPAPVATPIQRSAPAAPPAPTRPAAAAAPESRVATVTLAPHLDPKNPIAADRSVYFDFDVYSIKPTYAALVERHGRYLSDKRVLSVKVEGHADERGGAEYNLALGQRRAQAVVVALRLMGVRDAQMEAISWGEERPRNPGHDEAAWAENRRADIVYPQR